MYKPFVVFGSLTVLLLVAQQDDAPPNYFRDIKPIVSKKCLSCHYANGHGPFSLETYAEVQKRAGLIRDVAVLHSMPPTDAQSDFGTVASQDPLTDAETLLIQKWWLAGCPKGIGTEGLELNHGPSTEASVKLTVFKNQVSKEEGRPYWVAMAILAPRDIRIGAYTLEVRSPKAIRQAQLYHVQNTEGKKFLKEPLETLGIAMVSSDTLVGAWSPGNPDWKLPDDAAIDVQKGDYLVLQLQVHPTGKKESLESQILVSEHRSAKRTPKWIALTKDNFVIPAEERLDLWESSVLDFPFQLVSVVPEARFFCKQIRLTAQVKGADPKTILLIHTWNPFWAGSYQYAGRIAFPKETVLRATLSYDNGKHSSSNEGRGITDIASGPSLDQEMFRVLVQVVGE